MQQYSAGQLNPFGKMVLLQQRYAGAPHHATLTWAEYTCSAGDRLQGSWAMHESSAGDILEDSHFLQTHHLQCTVPAQC